MGNFSSKSKPPEPVKDPDTIELVFDAEKYPQAEPMLLHRGNVLLRKSMPIRLLAEFCFQGLAEKVYLPDSISREQLQGIIRWEYEMEDEFDPAATEAHDPGKPIRSIGLWERQYFDGFKINQLMLRKERCKMLQLGRQTEHIRRYLRWKVRGMEVGECLQQVEYREAGWNGKDEEKLQKQWYLLVGLQPRGR